MKLEEVLGFEVGIGVAVETEEHDHDGALDDLARDTTCERPEPPERYRVCRSCSGSGEAGDGPLSFCTACRGSGRIAE